MRVTYLQHPPKMRERMSVHCASVDCKIAETTPPPEDLDASVRADIHNGIQDQ